jgi:hypothetical protein
VWFGYERFIGDDIAQKISDWFLYKKAMIYPRIKNDNYLQKISIPYHMRLSPQEVVFNRYNVWKYIPKNDLSRAFLLLRVSRKANKVQSEIRNLFSRIKTLI